MPASLAAAVAGLEGRVARSNVRIVYGAAAELLALAGHAGPAVLHEHHYALAARVAIVALDERGGCVREAIETLRELAREPRAVVAA